MKINSKTSGVVLVEVLIATGILGTLLVPVLDFFVTSIEANLFAAKEVSAQALLQQQLEAVRTIRERNWDQLEDGGFYLAQNGNQWQLVPSATGQTVNGFTQKIEILSVYRDTNDQIIASGGRLDPSTKKIVASVSWHLLRDRQLSLETYLTRYLDNLSWVQTTVADFTPGEFELTKILDPVSSDGEVILEGGCTSGSPAALIYDDKTQNGWRINCDGFGCKFWDLGCWISYYLCKTFQFFSNAEITEKSAEYTWNGSAYAMKIILKPSGWSWVRLYNFNAVCTKGFKTLHFYAYNPSAAEISFNLTAHYNEWETTEVVLPPGQWTEVTINYDTLEEYQTSLDSLYFHKWLDGGDPQITFYVDQVELTGGVGGYFTEGTFTSSVLDAGRQTAFNRLSYTASLPLQTEVGFQVAVSDSATGPWLFYGPGGTTSVNDLYKTAAGQGLWLGNNFGRYLRYKSYLRSLDGDSTPQLQSATINYSP